MSDAQICALLICREATDGEPCAHCPLVAPVEVRDAKTQAVLDSLERSIEQGKALTQDDYDRSADNADLIIIAAIAFVFLVALMWMMSSLPRLPVGCGGVM
ncbi:MAG: hypothetical protein VXW65_12205 [Pseudomonadota bacterium]|nr:hypothetical protein [Pseudomonadota bacterium]